MQAQGHVYLLVSENSQFVKIGGTEFPPLKRIREINQCEPYRSLGPWTLHDFRQVADWRKVESFLHYAFRGSLAAIDGAKELFAAAPHVVSQKLLEIEPEQLLGRPKIDRMFNDAECAGYIERLFAFTGLLRWLDIQGAWVFVLFPATAGGRYFTLNIGPHEVAFVTLPRKERQGGSAHMLMMDRLIYDCTNVMRWLKKTSS